MEIENPEGVQQEEQRMVSAITAVAAAVAAIAAITAVYEWEQWEQWVQQGRDTGQKHKQVGSFAATTTPLQTVQDCKESQYQGQCKV